MEGILKFCARYAVRFLEFLVFRITEFLNRVLQKLNEIQFLFSLEVPIWEVENLTNNVSCYPAYEFL